ncbi:tail fiber domain-containing protein [Streptomyces formicae]|uniref:Tail fiber domain-containing protein n=1 Tax=Streptomyces formicae TaxID=1616117 RepID=A0ABY3X035_9ACTN|nr:tail fiber domain-containing protein [Streptomyces formicae]UNM16160.1 tail fiber domain-containing protein [Streptomyces formicae]
MTSTEGRPAGVGGPAPACGVPRLTVNSQAGSQTLARPGGPVNGFEILDKISALPISTWRYHWEDPGIRHLGPMSQDFKAAFGLGRYDTSIDCVDINGVTLLAIQALHRLVNELREEIDALGATMSPAPRTVTQAPRSAQCRNLKE